MAAPKLLYPAGLAFYLYKLLNPESTGVAPADADSTNPVETEPRLASAHESDPEREIVVARVLEAPPGAAPLPREPEPFDLTPSEIAQALGDREDSNDFEPDAFTSEDASTDDDDDAGDAFAMPELSLTDPALLEAARPRRPVRAGGTGALPDSGRRGLRTGSAHRHGEGAPRHRASGLDTRGRSGVELRRIGKPSAAAGGDA